MPVRHVHGAEVAHLVGTQVEAVADDGVVVIAVGGTACDVSLLHGHFGGVGRRRARLRKVHCMCASAHTHAHTHTRTHARTHTHTHTHMYS